MIRAKELRHPPREATFVSIRVFGEHNRKRLQLSAYGFGRQGGGERRIPASTQECADRYVRGQMRAHGFREKRVQLFGVVGIASRGIGWPEANLPELGTRFTSRIDDQVLTRAQLFNA